MTRMAGKTGSWIQKWEEVRKRLPAVNLVFKGHPLHALLTDLPAALLPVGFGFTLWGRANRQRLLEAAGYAATVTGVAAAVPTALSGLADYLQMEVTDPAQKTGFIHGLLNVLAVGLSAGSLVGRRMDRRAPDHSIWLGGLATGVLLVSAYLGGDLVYHRGWRVKPIEREEMETRRVPPTVHDDDFILRRSAQPASVGPID
jgi:uncharacterized membrane protein